MQGEGRPKWNFIIGRKFLNTMEWIKNGKDWGISEITLRDEEEIERQEKGKERMTVLSFILFRKEFVKHPSLQ